MAADAVYYGETFEVLPERPRRACGFDLRTLASLRVSLVDVNAHMNTIGVIREQSKNSENRRLPNQSTLDYKD